MGRAWNMDDGMCFIFLLERSFKTSSEFIKFARKELPTTTLVKKFGKSGQVIPSLPCRLGEPKSNSFDRQTLCHLATH